MSNTGCVDCENCSGAWEDGKVYCFAKEDWVQPIRLYDKCVNYFPRIIPERYGDD